jgi:hypothetical protein
LKLRLAVISSWLFIFMLTSFGLCLSLGSGIPLQTECLPSGYRVCSMQGEECCLTESREPRTRTVKRMLASGSYLADMDWR